MTTLSVVEQVSTLTVSEDEITLTTVGVQGPQGVGAEDGDKGDITVTSSGTVWTIDNGAVTLAKTHSGVQTSLGLADSAVQPATLTSGLAGKSDTGHTHTASNITDFDTEVANNTTVDANTTARHTHSNKALLDTYAQTEANLADAVTKKHTHSNQAVLDATTASFLTADETKLDGIEASAEVNNISDANATDLTDGGETILHIHDSRYYTESEVDTALSGKANSSHTHAQSDITDLTTDLAGKQATLVSGTNIKTINSTSLLGSGDIVISGGGGLESTDIDTKAEINAILTDGDFLFVGDVTQYTDELAQDAVGTILTDSSEIDFTYDDATPSITASIIAGSIDETKLDASVNASLDLADTSLQPANISDTAYAGSWNGVTTIAPSKNAVYDKFESLLTNLDGGNASTIGISLITIDGGTA